MKKLDVWDIGLTKLSVLAFVLFVLIVWPALGIMLLSVNPWYYFILFVVFAIRPFYKFWGK
jgi:hypothetical protein